MHPILNALGFQAGWWACVLGVSRGWERPALLLAAALALVHLRLAAQPRKEAQLALIALVLGVVVDTLLQTWGVIHFEGLAWAPLSPYWLWMLWILFALTLNASLAFLRSLPLAVSAVAGGIFGPLTYHAGAALGAASLTSTPSNTIQLVLAWALAMPCLILMARKTLTPPEERSDES